MLRFRSAAPFGCALAFLIFCAGSMSVDAGQGKHKKQTAAATKKAAKNPATDIPLPIGHEAKKIILPDYDTQGRLSNRFDAGIAKRIDEDHVQLRDLKMTTYTTDGKVDLNINMSDSVLDLQTRIIASQQPTTVRRTDFTIVGDTMQFNTATRQGTMVGNVKMVITGNPTLGPKKSE